MTSFCFSRLLTIQLLLLVLFGVVGCGQDPVVALNNMGATIDQDDAGRVIGVMLAGPQITDDGLVHLDGLTNLVNLHLRDTAVTDAGLFHLQGLTDLTNLVLSGSRITTPD